MNVELYFELKNKKKEIKAKDDALCKEYEANKKSLTHDEQLEVSRKHEDYKAEYAKLAEDIKKYEKLADLFEKGEISESDLIAYENQLANKYGFVFVEEKPVEVKNKKKAKKRTVATLLAILGLAGSFTAGALIEHFRHGKCDEKALEGANVSASIIEAAPTPTPVLENAAGEKVVIEESPVEAAIDEVVAETVVETPVVTPEPTPVALPFDTYGQFTDVNNEEQLRARATWYYNTYIADPNKPSHAGANFFSIEEIMDDMRMINGEFMQNADGSITYNDTDMINVANDLHTIANYDSFKQYGTQIYFTPMAPLFEDGSLAQKGAIDLDVAMEKVVAAIRANDDEAFLAAAKEWGTIVINMFNYVDFTGEYVNIYQVEYPTSFALYHAMSSKYASTILEYSEAHHLNVCIDYCTDYETGEMHQAPLSEIMYTINEIPQDAVAVRSGHQAEYEANNLSLPEILFVGAKDYFNSKYDMEHGCSLTLK